MGFFTQSSIVHCRDKGRDDLDGEEQNQANLTTAHAHASAEPPLGPD